jgi:hypothetical protein
MICPDFAIYSVALNEDEEAVKSKEPTQQDEAA